MKTQNNAAQRPWHLVIQEHDSTRNSGSVRVSTLNEASVLQRQDHLYFLDCCIKEGESEEASLARGAAERARLPAGFPYTYEVSPRARSQYASWLREQRLVGPEQR